MAHGVSAINYTLPLCSLRILCVRCGYIVFHKISPLITIIARFKMQ